MSELILLEDVKKTYWMGEQGVAALDGVTLRFAQGSFWAFMGPSGSGKSTLLNLLGCLDRPTEGRYLLEGRDVSELDDDDRSELRLRRLGFIFQSFNLIPDLNVFDNVDVPLRYRGMTRKDREQRIQSALHVVGLSSRMHHMPSQLSGGQQQRARSHARSPAIRASPPSSA